MATQMLSLSQPFGNRSADLCILARRAAIKAVKGAVTSSGCAPVLHLRTRNQAVQPVEGTKV